MKRTRNLYDDDDASSSEFHRRKLRLKVKLAEKKSEDEDDQSPQQPQRKHFCVICEKQFSSGKAYGGHVRIHSTEYNDKGKMKKKKKKRKISLVKKEKEKEIRDDMEEDEIRCCVCGKQFQTMHSLYGHMSRHPDRSWNGIRPPTPPEKFKLSYLADDDDDEEDVIMSRSMNATEDVQEAAWILMMLYYASIKDDQEADAGSLMMLKYTSINCSAGMEKPLESPKSEVRSLSKVLDDGGMDDDDKKGLIEDMDIKMEIEVKVDSPPRDEAKRSLRLDLNQPPDH